MNDLWDFINNNSFKKELKSYFVLFLTLAFFNLMMSSVVLAYPRTNCNQSFLSWENRHSSRGLSQDDLRKAEGIIEHLLEEHGAEALGNMSEYEIEELVKEHCDQRRIIGGGLLIGLAVVSVVFLASEIVLASQIENDIPDYEQVVYTEGGINFTKHGKEDFEKLQLEKGITISDVQSALHEPVLVYSYNKDDSVTNFVSEECFLVVSTNKVDTIRHMHCIGKRTLKKLFKRYNCKYTCTPKDGSGESFNIEIESNDDLGESIELDEYGRIKE